MIWFLFLVVAAGYLYLGWRQWLVEREIRREVRLMEEALDEE